MTDQLIVWGTGGHAVSVSETIFAAGRRIDYFVSEDSNLAEFLGCRVLQNLSDLKPGAECNLVVAIGDNSARELVAASAAHRYPHIKFPVFIHPSASVASSARVASGTLVMQGAVIGAYAEVGEFCVVNSRANLDHECLMQDFASLAPGVTTGGRVSIGRRSAISLGAAIKHGVEIGEDVVIGAGSYVNRSIPDRSVAFGSPATIRRSRSPGDPYLG